MTDEQTTARKDMAKIVNAMLALIAFSEQYGENGEEPMLFNEIIQIAKSAIPLAESLPGKIEALEQDRDDARRELSDAPDPADARLAALEIGLLKEKIAEAEAQKERLREALTPGGATKSAYIGEFKFYIDDMDDDGNEFMRSITVPWTTTKEIMKAILARAALTGAPPTSEDSPGRL